ncbi:MAG: aminoacyl-tRNA hydrolase [Deltaproteobacteria bacterium]|nr:aminoacyl-tRNA hydrolase [Deltaproteobacteria bacterium]
MRVIVGLGNPGPEYRRTRHNVGFRVTDFLADRWGTRMARHAFLSVIGEAFWRGEKILLVQPQTYMNRSGEAAVRLRDFYRLAPSDFVVVHDDLDLPLGRLRIKSGGGGAGGNRGVASLIASLGSKDFPRVKLGVGRPPSGHDPADFLLQPFTLLEEAFIRPAVARAAEAIEVLLIDGVERAMSCFNNGSQDLAADKIS